MGGEIPTPPCSTQPGQIDTPPCAIAQVPTPGEILTPPAAHPALRLTEIAETVLQSIWSLF